MARPPRRGVGMAWTSRSRGWAMAPKSTAKRRAPVGGVGLDEGGDGPADVLGGGAVGVADGPPDERADLLHVALGHALRRDAGGADSDAAGDGRGLRVVRDGVLVQHDA